MATMTETKRVRDRMSHEVIAAFPSDTVHETLSTMIEDHVSAMPVIDSKNRCIGMVSASDLLELTQSVESEIEFSEENDATAPWLVSLLTDSLGHKWVSEVMTSPVATIEAEATLAQAAQLMITERVHRLPVVDRNGRLVGLLSTMDIMQEVANGSI